MEEAKRRFEAMWEAKGKPVPVWKNGKYVVKNVQTYWRWFYMGWTMKGSK